MMKQYTLIVLKPDAVERNLVGKILNIFEEACFKIEALTVLVPQRSTLENHYPNDETWLNHVAAKTIALYDSMGLVPNAEFGTEDQLQVGNIIRDWIIDYMTSSNVVSCILSGNRAVENARKIVGDTFPIKATPSSIRGRFSIDSPDTAAVEKRAIRNLIHASATEDEAIVEISNWYPNFSIDKIDS